MYWIVLYFILVSATCDELSNGTVSDLDSMFKSLNDNTFDDYPSNLVVKKLYIDLDKLDFKNVTDKLNAMKRKLNRSGDADVFMEFETRRLGSHGTYYQRLDATNILVQTKIFDLMLQIIYMARHKVKQIESDPYFNPRDTTYRIAFLYRRIRRIWKRLHDLYTTMVKNIHEVVKHRKKFQYVDTYLNLHHKSAKLHVDFLYMWWVMVKLHEKYHYHHYVPNTTPQENKYV